MWFSPLVALGGWAANDWRTAIEWGSWCASIGIVMMMVGHLLGYGFMDQLAAFAAGALFPALGFMYVYGNGNSWAWLLGWSVVGFGVVEGFKGLKRLRQPSELDYEYALSILTPENTIPYAANFMMVLLTLMSTVSLGVFLVLANVSIRGYLATSAPLGVFGATLLLYAILFVRYHKAIMRGR